MPTHTRQAASFLHSQPHPIQKYNDKLVRERVHFSTCLLASIFRSTLPCNFPIHALKTLCFPPPQLQLARNYSSFILIWPGALKGEPSIPGGIGIPGIPGIPGIIGGIPGIIPGIIGGIPGIIGGIPNGANGTAPGTPATGAPIICCGVGMEGIAFIDSS
mmetsp:Transcript_31010/g.81425  ORF Transcript_31010/g.81425 Transcript_31010/m.81425 type:complete len:160 (-) Transcript_31010:497-976(-)